MSDAPKPLDDVVTFYERCPEESRFDAGRARLEFERTKDVLARVLPPAPCRVVDVGGAAGAYSLWLAARGYEVHLVDATPRLVEMARRRSAAAEHPIASMSVGDARRLPQADAFASAALVMGPLYHLPDQADRRAALSEAARVLAPGGVLVAAAIGRFASALDGLVRGLSRDPVFRAIRDQDLRDGQHRNTTEILDYFTTSYFHRPDGLVREIEAAGFRDAYVLGVEGPGWLLADLDERWDDGVLREDILAMARRLEREPSVAGASAHLLGVALR